MNTIENLSILFCNKTKWSILPSCEFMKNKWDKTELKLTKKKLKIANSGCFS